MIPANQIDQKAATALMVAPHSEHVRQKIFFPNLDGLRFFSFLLVFLAHSFVTDYEYIKNERWYRLIKIHMFSDGDIGVSFFFVLSGFLITYLLMKENEFTGKIDVRSFYMRRILRIWPLYYLCVIIGFVVFPVLKSSFGEVPNETANPWLCSLFLNNFDRIIHGVPDSSILSVLWSVAIEEQFYLVWPILFLLVPQKYYHYLFLLVIAISLAYRALYINKYLDIQSLGVISDMAIGGLGAYLSIKSKRFLEAIQNSSPLLNLVPFAAVLFFLVFKKNIFITSFMIVVQRVIITFFFIWIILEQNFCTRSYFKVSQLKTISRMGKYTYGLYCLHSIAVLIVITSVDKLGWNKSSWQLWFIVLPAALGLSILMSYISYRWYESKFLKLKDKFAYIVKS